jgi:hypothetical protein
MAIFNFGSCSITHNSVNLGKSFGGGSINMKTEEINEIQTIYAPDLLFLSGSGEINMFSWNSTITITDTLELLTPAVTIFESTDFIIELYSCGFHINKSIVFGLNEQKPITLTFAFGKDSSGNIMQIRES